MKQVAYEQRGIILEQKYNFLQQNILETRVKLCEVTSILNKVPKVIWLVVGIVVFSTDASG